jgi:ERCC4-related helicase
LGLSATPGTDIKSIQKVITTLNISEIEAKTENDHDVMQYIHKRQEDVIIVEQPDAISRIDAKFSDLMAHSIERLHSNNVGRGIIHNHHSLKTYSLMKVKEKFKERNPNDHSLDGTFQMLFEMAGIRNQLYSHGVLTVRNRLQTLQRYPKPGMGAVVKGEKFQALLREVSKATHATQDSQDDDQEATKDLLKNNPKYKELHKLLVGELMYIVCRLHRAAHLKTYCACFLLMSFRALCEKEG